MTNSAPIPAEVKTNPAVDTATPSNPVLYASAVKTGRAVLEKEGSKAAAAREIYTLLKGEHRDVILRAFMEGATCTPKGAPTYLYSNAITFGPIRTAATARQHPAPQK